MQKEIKQAALLGVMMLLFLSPCGVYMLSFRSEGLLGQLLGYLGIFMLLPYWLIKTYYGLPSWAHIAGVILGQYLWYMLWAAAISQYMKYQARTTQPAD
jgi:hypothetical protein